MIRKLSILFVLVLLASACAEESPVGGAPAVGDAETAALSETETSTETEGSQAGSQDDEATQDDDEASHGDDAFHDDDEASHDDDDASHDDEEASHDEGNGGEHEAEAVAADRTVEIVMTDMAFAPTSLDVKAGETIRFLIRNDGVLEHEFRLSNAHRIEEHLASGHDDHDDGGGGHHDEGGDVFLVLLGGESGELSVTFPEDQSIFTEIACLIPGHYELGMKGELSYSS